MHHIQELVHVEEEREKFRYIKLYEHLQIGFVDALLIVAMEIELKALREGVILIKF